MDFFVEVKESNNQKNDEPARSDLEILVIGKRAGFSFEEMNELRVQDIVDLIEIESDLFGDPRKRKPRMATQADIDAFFA
jgi:hypothetical protein